MEEPGRVTTMGRRERRQHETRERLFAAAMRLLSERDFADVTVEMITEAADVGKGTFFNYFPNKEAVVTYRFEQKFQMLASLLGKEEAGNEDGRRKTEENATLNPQPSTLNSPGGPVWQRIVATMHAVGDSDARSKRLARNLLALGLVNDAVRTASLHVHQRVCEIAEHLIVEGQESGEFRADLSSSALGGHLRGVYLNTLYQWAETDDEEDLHEVLDRNLSFAWRSMRHPNYAK